MDSRTALKNGTVLRFNDGYEYTIINELARGGSSIVYNAFYLDNLGARKTVRIKECYPFKCNLGRSMDGALLVPMSEKTLFLKTMRKMRQSYQLGNDFFSTDGLTNLTANTYNIFEANNTLYIVSAYAQGKELSYQRYPAVKDSIALVKSTANAVQKIHNRGFLYLDIKPDNILTLEGTTELVQLFDFDTVVPISDIMKSGDKISYTRGFSPLELKCGDFRQIGTHTDVYGIGALLFYMLFDRVPDAFDCEIRAEYDFTKSKLSEGSYQDSLFFRLEDFFHHTLADYYPDRFSSMEIVIEKLSELQKMADLSARYIVSSRLGAYGLFLGRKKEEEWITEKLKAPDTACFFIVGMGGIGKSTLVRHSIRKSEQYFDTVLYLNYLGTIEKTLCDDYAVHINSVQKDKHEIDKAYFDRKLNILRELGRDKNCLLVIDNYTGDFSDAFPKLLQLGWRILFVTRNRSLAVGYDYLEVGPITENETLLALFSKNFGRELTVEEKECASAMIHKVGGHTLVIELIAKQIGNPVCGLSLKRAAEIVEHTGFSNITVESVNYQKDSTLYHNTIRQIVSQLFEAEALPESQRTITKVLSLFGSNGVSLDCLSEMLGLKNRESISILYYQGWIYVNDTIITMHPVIEEVVSNWEISETERKAIIKTFDYLIARLKGEAQKEKYSSYIYLARAVLEEGKRQKEIYFSDRYKELLYYTIRNTPYENESFVKKKSEEYIALFDNGNKKMLLLIYEGLLEILYEYGQFDEAERRIRQIRMVVSSDERPEIRGRYYYILSGYYDAVLNGAYDAETDEEAKIVALLLDSVDQAIRWLGLSYTDDSRVFLGECYRLKALVLIRSGLGKRRQIQSILKNAQMLIDRYAQPNSRLLRDYDMTLSWFYTYFNEDYRKSYMYMLKACKITDIIADSELAKIDEQFCPMANIMLEWRRFEDAEQYLQHCLTLCENRLEITAYRKRKMDLLGYLLQVYFIWGKSDKCRNVIAILDDMTDNSDEPDIEQLVPDKIRNAVLATFTGK
ncbi:NB-ARC domain-containing protein [Hominifimenecus microfluidus]|uniref:protein kinase domain-containing protein n=1 Tax=Hominifimenecus microfluidus TaxID=2885348 RepID=UPI0032C0C308